MTANPAPPTNNGDEREQGIAAQAMAALTALQFLTVAPPIIKRAFTPQEMGAAVGYFPLVGLLIGMLLALVDVVSRLVMPASVASALVLTVWVASTGALHLDGFLDTCDGLLGGFTPERRMEIMRDHRIGAFALAGGVCLMLLKYATVAAMPMATPALLLTPIIGRWVISLAVVRRPYARPQGVGSSLKENAGPAQVVIATAITVLLAFVIGGIPGLAMVALAWGLFWLVARYVMGKIPGLTGDIYGALCELIEAALLLTFVFVG